MHQVPFEIGAAQATAQENTGGKSDGTPIANRRKCARQLHVNDQGKQLWSARKDCYRINVRAECRYRVTHKDAPREFGSWPTPL